MSSIEDRHHDLLRAWVTMADGQITAPMTLAAGYDILAGQYGGAYVKRAGVINAGVPNLYSAEEAALCGAAHFDDEQWGGSALSKFLREDPDARWRAIEDRLADEAKAALSEFGLPLKDYDMEVQTEMQTRASDDEIEARVELTHQTTGATISVKDMHLALDTGEVMTPSHPDHEGTGMLLFP